MLDIKGTSWKLSSRCPAESKRLGFGMHLYIPVYIPFTFPPALTDADRGLQAAHLAAARNLGGAAAVLSEAVTAAAREQTGADIDALPSAY